MKNIPAHFGEKHFLSLLLFTPLLTLNETQKPNVLVILLDDAGYNDIGFVGSKSIKTPKYRPKQKTLKEGKRAFATIMDRRRRLEWCSSWHLQ